MSIKKMSLSARWRHFWFQPISAVGFGMMRIGFGTIAFITFALEWSRVSLFYTNTGILPHSMVEGILRTTWRFSLLDTASTPTVWVFYIVLLLALALTALGVWTRLALIVSVVLMYSFHEYALITLDGGDTLLRLIGLILAISPCDRAMTLTNMRRRMHLVKKTGKDQPEEERRMPIWPYRLLLWQMIILYIASSVEKFTGSTWREGSAVAITLHHGNFSRLPLSWADALSWSSPGIGWFTMISQFAWILLLLIPILIWMHILPRASQKYMKRMLLLSGVLLHGAIFLMMDVGTFSLTVFVSYLGLLLADDMQAIRNFFNRKHVQSVVVLYDGRCGLCRPTAVLLKSFDWLKRLTIVNFRDPKVKKEYADTIEMSDLDEAMHVRLGNLRYAKGFFGFRSLTWKLPPLWIIAPFLHLPGIQQLGTRVYAYIAKNRPRCTDDHCTL